MNTLDCDYMFCALDDEMDIDSFLKITPDHSYRSDDYGKEEYDYFISKSKKYAKQFDKLIKKYKTYLKEIPGIPEDYLPFNNSFKNFCQENISTVINDKMVVISREFNGNKHKMVVLSIQPYNLSFIVLLNEEKGVEFCFGLNCGMIVIANQKFIYENCESEIEDLFLGKKKI